MEQPWVINLLRQCQAVGVPFFFKQWGGVQKKKAGRMLQGRTYDEMPDRPAVPPPSGKEREEMIREVEGWWRSERT